MWWFDSTKQNDLITDTIFGSGHGSGASATNNCTVQDRHKVKPSPEPDSFTECHLWADSSCCHEDNVESAEALKTMYGSAWQWDRCGQMSQACERFVQEHCLYECDPNIGQYRRHNDSQVAGGANTWEICKMPIKASYCNAWYQACQEDYFCGGDDGNFFSCAAYYWVNIDEGGKKDGNGEILPLWGAILLVAALLFSIGMLCAVVMRERAGKPIFVPLATTEKEVEVGNRE